MGVTAISSKVGIGERERKVGRKCSTRETQKDQEKESKNYSRTESSMPLGSVEKQCFKVKIN